MSYASPSRSAGTLDRFLRKTSSSHSDSFYSRSPTKPKRLQSAHLDELSGLWRCKNCGYNYPNPEPLHHQRRAHKKICEGELHVQRWLSGSATEGTGDSHDTSTSFVGKPPTTPETADTATSALSLGKNDENDGAGGSRVPEGLNWEQLLDKESKANGTPAGNKLPPAGESQGLGGAKGEGHGEPTLSEQSGIVGGAGENSEVSRKEELDSGNDLKPLTGDPGTMQAQREAESGLSHDPSQGASDQVEFPGFEAVSKDFGSGNKEASGVETKEPLSLSSPNDADILKSSENVLKDVEERDPGLLAAADDAPKGRTGAAEGDEPSPLSHGEQGLMAGDNLSDKKAEGLQASEDGELTLRGDDDAQKGRGDMGEESSDILKAADVGALGEKGKEIGTEHGIAANDEDGKDQVKESGPSGFSGDGTEKENGDTLQSLQFPRDGGDEAFQSAPLLDQSGHLDNATEEAGELYGEETLEVVSEAEGANDIPSTSRGKGRFSSAERNWDDWEHVVSGGEEDTLAEVKGPPGLQEVGEGGLPFAAEGLISHGQSDNLENDDAPDKGASQLEKASAGLESDQDAGKEVGFQPAGVDWILGFPDTGNNAVEKQPPESQSSNSGDYHSSRDQDAPELIPGLDQEGGGNVDLVATLTPASQQQGDQPNKVAATLSAAETNWDDWEDVIKSGGITLEKAGDPGSSSGEYLTPRVGSLGDVSGSDQGKTGTVLESECVEGVVIDTASAGLPVPIPKSESSDWLIDFSEPSVESNLGTSNEATPGPPAASTGNLEVPETKFFDLLELNEGSGQVQGASVLDATPVTSQSETGQSSNLLSKFSSAMRNWEDWEDVVRESERVSEPEKTSPPLESDLLGVGEHQTGLDSPHGVGTNIVETGSIEPAGLEDALVSHPVASYSTAAGSSGQEVEGVTQEADGALSPKKAGNGMAKNREFLDSGLGRSAGGGKELDSKDESPLEGLDRLSSAKEDWDDWEEVQKGEDVTAESRVSSPSFEDAHDGELSSEHEYQDGRTADVKLGTAGKRPWADWEDLTNSDYMMLDGPRGEKLTFKRVPDPSTESLSGNPSGSKIAPSFEDPDDDGSPFLRRNGRAQPFEDGKILKSTSPIGVVKADYPPGSTSSPGIETSPRSLPGSSPRKSAVGDTGDKEPLVTRRPLIYRDSRRDYSSEVEDMEDVTSETQDESLQHHHHHNQLQQEEALNYDVEKVIRGQTKYELICPICGALITRKIILRKKKRRFLSEGDPRWRRDEIALAADPPAAADDGNQSPRSDISSEMEDASANWNKGIRPCFGYLFGR